MITLANAPVPYGAFGLSRPDLVGIPSGADLRQLVQAAGYRGIDLGAHGLLGTRQEPVDNLVAHGLWLCGGWIDFPFADSDSGIEHFLQDTSTDLTFDSGHLLLGQGDLELEELLQEIVDGFDGWLVVEQDVVVELPPSRLETLSHRYGVARTGCFATVGELAVAIHDGPLAVDAAIIATTGGRVDDALALLCVGVRLLVEKLVQITYARRWGADFAGSVIAAGATADDLRSTQSAQVWPQSETSDRESVALMEISHGKLPAGSSLDAARRDLSTAQALWKACAISDGMTISPACEAANPSHRMTSAMPGARNTVRKERR